MVMFDTDLRPFLVGDPPMPRLDTMEELRDRIFALDAADPDYMRKLSMLAERENAMRDAARRAEARAMIAAERFPEGR